MMATSLEWQHVKKRENIYVLVIPWFQRGCERDDIPPFQLLGLYVPLTQRSSASLHAEEVFYEK